VYKWRKKSCSQLEIEIAEIEIENFLDGFITVSAKIWRYNVHICAFIIDCQAIVHFQSSAYLYENDLGRLKQLVKCYRNVPQQLFNKLYVREYVIACSENNHRRCHEECDKKFYSELNGVVYRKLEFRIPFTAPLTVEEQILLRQYDINALRMYKKCILPNFIITISGGKRQSNCVETTVVLRSYENFSSEWCSYSWKENYFKEGFHYEMKDKYSQGMLEYMFLLKR